MKKWYCIAMFNLVVLALLGLLLRYKINFPLPFIEQKNLLHAHSHFAFNGWISFLLQLVLLQEFSNNYQESPRFWNLLFAWTTLVNYGMIISFSFTGYGPISIALSTVALWLSYIFVFKVHRNITDESKNKISTLFVKASLFFLILSSLGPYALAIIMATKSTHEYWYHNALYFFLHFQYNGWFTFAVLALLIKRLEQSRSFKLKAAKRFFILLAVTCIPSYLFTSLWHHRPLAVTVVNVITAILQTTALIYLVKLLKQSKEEVYRDIPGISKWLYNLAIAAFAIKILLQFFSVHPVLGQLAFGYRPIIIGYLHLIFLGFISMYLLGHLANKEVIPYKNTLTSSGLITFATGIVLNEILLVIQGLSSILFFYFPMINLLLFVNTIILVAGAILILIPMVERPYFKQTYSFIKSNIKLYGNFRSGNKLHSTVN